MDKMTFLFLTLMSLALWHGAESSSISVIPSTINVGVTETLTVICAGSGSLPTMPILVSLTLMASDTGPDGPFLPVATTSATIPFQTFPSSLGGQGTATFHPRGPSSIQVTWTSPGKNLARLYKCNVMGLDPMWMYATVSDAIDVSYKSAAEEALNIPVVPANSPAGTGVSAQVINGLSSKIRDLFIKINGLETMAAEFGLQSKRQFAQIETNIKNNVEEIKELKQALSSRGGSNTGVAAASMASVSSPDFSNIQSRLELLEASYEQMSESSTAMSEKMEELTSALDKMANQDLLSDKEVEKRLNELAEKVQGGGSSSVYVPTIAPIAASPGRSSFGSDGCCQAVNQLQAAVQAMAANGQTIVKRVDKLTLWTSAVRDSEFEVSDVFAGNRYYLLKRASNFDLDAAHWNCMRFGGYLVEVDDEAEYNFVVGFIKGFEKVNRVYTGANDVGTEKTWLFRFSQRPVEFFKWARGQPDNRRRIEDCMYIDGNNGMMLDGYCQMQGDYSKFVCEVPE